MRLRHIAIIATTALISATTAFADPIEGLWKTQVDDNGNFGQVEVKPCGAAFCGTLVKAFNGKGQQVKSDNVGKRIIWDMIAKGNGDYADGKVFAPDRNKTYNSKLKLSGNNLEVKGCILGVCRNGGTWTRVN